jgi:hypothetical protein
MLKYILRSNESIFVSNKGDMQAPMRQLWGGEYLGSNLCPVRLQKILFLKGIDFIERKKIVFSLKYCKVANLSCRH